MDFKLKNYCFGMAVDIIFRRNWIFDNQIIEFYYIIVVRFKDLLILNRY